MATSQPDPTELRQKHIKKMARSGVAVGGAVGVVTAFLLLAAPILGFIFSLVAVPSAAALVVMGSVADYVEEYHQHYE